MRIIINLFKYYLIILLFIQLPIISQAKLIEGEREVLATDLLNGIEISLEDGMDVAYNNLIINGDLDFSKMNFSKIDGEIKIENSIINGKVSLNCLNISKSIDFSNTTFNGEFFINNSNMGGVLDFNEAKFMNKSNFKSSIFNSDVEFKNTKFIKNAYFNDALFLGGECDFSNAVFSKDALFKNISFEGLAKFEEANFKGNAEFSDSKFKSMALFASSVFRDALFDGSTFEFDADFYNVTFDSANCNFDRAVFTEDALFEQANISYASFVGATFKGEAYFMRATFKNDALFNEAKFDQDVVFEGIKFDPLESIINLNNTRMEKLYGRWHYIDGHLEFNEEAYMYLIENYKNIGLRTDANDCYYKYRLAYEKTFFPICWEQSCHPLKNLIYRAIDLVIMSIYGYGVKPLRTFLFGLSSVIVIGLIYWRFDNYDLIKAIKFSSVVFLSGTGRLFVKTPEYKPGPKEGSWKANILRIIFTIEQVLGAITFVSLLIGINNTILW